MVYVVQAIMDHLAQQWRAHLDLPVDMKRALEEQGALLCVRLVELAIVAVDEAKWAEAEQLGKELEELSWEGLHSGAAWRDVSECVRGAYVKAQLLLGLCEGVLRDHDAQALKSRLRRLDMALLMGPPVFQSSLNALAEGLQALLDETEQEQERRHGEGSNGVKDMQATLTADPFTIHLGLDSERRAADGSASLEVDTVMDNGHVSNSPRRSLARKRRRVEERYSEVQRVEAPSLTRFLTQFMQLQVPVVLTGCMQGWPAMGALPEYRGRSWANLEYIKNVAGRRTVPVEVGEGTYLSDDSWGQKLMTIAEFIDEYVIADSGGGGGKGYLAQHELFEQIPALRRDIITPDYCALSMDDGEEGDSSDDGQVIVNAWFGPSGTESPAHTDPYHNLLAQVVGTKLVTLFPTSETPKLYPHAGFMNNNSQVDVKHPDLDRFPLVAEARGYRCVLGPGELLFIPPFYWHHIESLTTSFSVSFWWCKAEPPQMSAAIPSQEETREL